MGAFGAAISGLESSQQWLSVISNNVANSQTVGFKASELNFATLISQDLSYASADNSAQNIGGVNAMQVGLGVTVGSIALDLQQGSIQTTGNVTDIAIQGQGYLITQTGSQTQYTRAGNLTFDSNGDLVTANGALVQGWSLKENIVDANPDMAAGYATNVPPKTVPAMVSANQTLNTSNISAIGDIIIPNNLQLSASASLAGLNPADPSQAGVALAGNLDSYTPDTNYNKLVAAGITTANADAQLGGANGPADAQLIVQNADATSNFTVYDSLGTPTNFTVYWYQTNNTPAMGASWSYFIFDTSNNTQPTAGVKYPDAGAFVLSGGANGGSQGAGVKTTLTDAVAFNRDGSLASNGNSTGVVGQNPAITLANIDGSITPFTFSLDLGTPNIPAAGTTPATWGKKDGLTGFYGGGTTNPATGVYTPNQTVYTKSTTGYEKGTLTGLSFNNTGGIEASFTNGQTIVVAQLALANFTNPGGLTNNGGNYFETTANTGSIQIGTAGTDGFGQIQGGALEQSNVQLSTELTNMILAQTMYQANSKVITTQGNLYTDLFNAIPA